MTFFITIYGIIEIKYGKKINLEEWRYSNKELIIKIQNINDRKTAYFFNNLDIFVDSLQFPKLKKGEYYWKDLIGCQVITMFNCLLGIVIDLIKTGSNDVLIVQSFQNNYFNNKKNIMIPFIKNLVIKNIDLLTNIIYIDWDPNF